MSNKVVTSNAAPGIDAGFLNALESALVAGGSTYFLTPYQLTTNPTVNAGTTTTLTAGGVGGIPSGAFGVLIAASITSATVGAYLQIGPNGGNLAHYPTLGNIQVANQYVNGPVTCPLSSNKIDVHANVGNIVLQTWYIYGYII